MHTLLILLDKEFRQFFRNPFLPKMVIGFPLLVMLVLPWVTTMDVRHIGITVVDNDHTTASRRLTQKIGASDYFTLHAVTEQYDTALAQMSAGLTDVIVEIPDRFERSLAEGQPLRPAISANGVNALKGSLGTQYTAQVIRQTLAELSRERGAAELPDPIAVLYRYNPTLEYRNYMIPALMIMLLILLCGFLPALNLVSEKESGTIEQINATPVKRLSFTLAKLIPYWIIGLAVLTLAMLLARWVYGLAPLGSVGAIYPAAALMILAMSGLGVTIANHSANMQQVMFLMFFFIMIFVLMGDLITPVGSMPGWAQWIARMLPPRYFIGVMRSVYLKGATFGELWPNYAALAGFALLFGSLAALTYKKQA